MAESYTEDELIGLYRDGKDDPHILEKLSDLACKPKEEVLNILHLHSLALDIQPEEKPPKNGHRRDVAESGRPAGGGGELGAGQFPNRHSGHCPQSRLAEKGPSTRNRRPGDAAAKTLYPASDCRKESVYGRENQKSAGSGKRTAAQCPAGIGRLPAGNRPGGQLYHQLHRWPAVGPVQSGNLEGGCP